MVDPSTLGLKTLDIFASLKYCYILKVSFFRIGCAKGDVLSIMYATFLTLSSQYIYTRMVSVCSIVAIEYLYVYVCLSANDNSLSLN